MKNWSVVFAAAALSMMVGGTHVEAARAKHHVAGLKGKDAAGNHRGPQEYRAKYHVAGRKGKIISVAADGSSIVIGHSKKKNGGSGTTIQIAANPSVTIDGIGGKRVADLEPGESVVVNPTSGAATTIIARHAHHKKKA